MADLLVELGCEELPAIAVARALEQFRNEIVTRLAAAGIAFTGEEILATPRRLIVSLTGLPSKQPEQVKEVRGPSIKAAYDANGVPQGPLLGYCKSQGFDLADLRNDGDYVWATKKTAGKNVEELLSDIIPDSILALNFDKSMRWGASRTRFARPIRWILALLDGEIIPCNIESVTSSNKSRGHRFNHPEEFAVTDFNHLVNELRSRQVEPDANIRRKIIVEGALAIASGVPEMSDALIEENVFLTEWPMPLEGAFAEQYLSLPDPVLVTAMAKHERFFPIRDTEGNITNKFISIRNGGDEDTVRKGNAWVLSARYNDAKFFFDEDANSSLDQFLEMTTRMTFQEKLGNVRSRTDRLIALGGFLADQPFFKSKKADVINAAKYSKADLSTGLVGELSSLQGVVGGIYAKREGFNDAVCRGIATQYAHESVNIVTNPSDEVSAAVILADQMDKLAGYLGIEQIPSGSSDPYGLRRAVTILIEISLKWPELREMSYLTFFEKAMELYASDGIELNTEVAKNALLDIFKGRYEALFDSIRYDVLAAALEGCHESNTMNPVEIKFRADAVAAGCDDKSFVQTATRPINLIRSTQAKELLLEANCSIDAIEASLDSEEASQLWKVAQEVEVAARAAHKSNDPVALAFSLKILSAPLHHFFESTMVMVDDAKTREARLKMLQFIADTLQIAGDWSKIVQDA